MIHSTVEKEPGTINTFFSFATSADGESCAQGEC
jgi:hypothetical protein